MKKLLHDTAVVVTALTALLGATVSIFGLPLIIYIAEGMKL